MQHYCPQSAIYLASLRIQGGPLMKIRGANENPHPRSSAVFLSLCTCHKPIPRSASKFESRRSHGRSHTRAFVLHLNGSRDRAPLDRDPGAVQADLALVYSAAIKAPPRLRALPRGRCPGYSGPGRILSTARTTSARNGLRMAFSRAVCPGRLIPRSQIGPV